jgi:YspA, cpYpsA-related SLOG family
MKHHIKVIIAGSRQFNNFEFMKSKLNPMFENIENCEIISGTANGADKMGEEYAKYKGYDIKQMPADWSKGKSAGYKRNVEMAEYALTGDQARLIVFWDGVSRGTQHMINIAKERNIKTKVILFK